MSEVIEVEVVDELPPGVKRAKDGSLRTMDGKFYKGNALTPFNPGRPKRINVEEMLTAITTEFPPSEIRSMLRHAWDVACKQNDPKQMMAVVQFVAYYTIGKPVQRSITAQIDPEEFRRLFQPESPKEDEGEVIDV